MAPLDPDWPRALSLLDTGLALPDEQRDAWLDQIASVEPAAVPLLRKLLHAHGRVQTQEILATLPKLMRSTPTTDSGAPGLHIGPFELLQPLGQGGMGSVWRARYADARLKRDVAVKLPASAEDPQTLATLRERFARERDFLAQLQHPHIARLYDAGVSESGQPFLAMEYVAGTAIDVYCDRQRLPIKARLLLFLQVLDAVAYAHQQLVLHRDLKAGNVLVDEHGQVRLLDFGVARLLPPPARGAAQATASHACTAASDRGPERTDLTERAGAAFTLGHAAPEQINHGALSTATDVYALGVMLYRLLTGLSPYQPSRDTRGALEDAVLLATPAAASSRATTSDALLARRSDAKALQKALRGDLDVVLAQALKKNPAERYTTVTALADDLRRHLAQQPISARPDSFWYLSSRFVARHRVAVAASSMAALALLATAGVAAWQAQVSVRNAALANKETVRANAAQKFFAGLLAHADPEKNKSVLALDRLGVDRAFVIAEQELAATPETLALVLKQLGELYLRFDVPAKYLEVQERRVAVLDALPDRRADDHVDAHIERARALQASPRAEDRAMAMDRALAAHQLAVARGARAGLVVTALCLLADLHAAAARASDADVYAGQAVQLAEGARPRPYEELALAYAQKGATAAKLGHFDESRAAFGKALTIDAGPHGRGKVEQLQTQILLARLELDAGRYEAAQQAALAALRFASEQLGEMEGTLGPARVTAVLATLAMGEAEQAFELAQQLLAEDLNAQEPLRLGMAHFAHGVATMRLGRLAQAKAAFAAAEPGLNLRPSWALNLKVQQAEWLLRSGQPVLAQALLAPVLAAATAPGQVPTEVQARLLERAGVACARQGQWERAQTAFEQACAGRRQRLQASHPDRVRCESYALMAAPTDAEGSRRKALALQLANLTQGRSDRMALTVSLKSALLGQGLRPADGRAAADFPLLN